MGFGLVVSALSADRVHTQLCLRHAVVFRLRCWIWLFPPSPPLRWATLSSSIPLDSLLSPLLPWLTRRCPLSLLFNTRKGACRCPRSGIYPIFCGCLNGTAFQGLARLCPRSRLTDRLSRVMIIVSRKLQQHIVARISVWRNLTGDGIWYDFEYTMRAAAVPFGFSSTVNTGYLNCG